MLSTARPKPAVDEALDSSPQTQGAPSISVIVPAHNEARSLPTLVERVGQTLQAEGWSYEILVVDDGSRDNTRAVLEELQGNHPRLRARFLDRQRGKSYALSCGLRAARGDTVVFMDADLQDVPEEVPTLLRALEDGPLDLVQGWREHRADSPIKPLASVAFNRMCSSLSGLHLHDVNCGLKVFRRSALTDLRLAAGEHRFVPLLAHRTGLRVGEVKVQHSPRAFGKSRYGWSRYGVGLRDLVRIALLPRLLEALHPDRQNPGESQHELT